MSAPSASADLTDSATTDSPALRKAAGNAGRWLLWLSLLTVALVVIGGIVRLTGSGLSIPEWPIINGSLLPPLTERSWEAVYKTYHAVIAGVQVDSVHHSAAPGIIPLGRFKQMFAIEYFHRFTAAAVGIVFLIALLKLLRHADLRRRFGGRLVLLFLLLLGQGIMGGIVVKYDLQAEFVAVHLGLAFTFFALTFWTALTLLRPPAGGGTYHNFFLSRIGYGAVVVLFLQIISGGLVAGTQAGHFLNTWPKLGGYWIPPFNTLWSESVRPALANLVENKVLLQFAHRWWAFLVLAAVLFLVILSLRFRLSLLARTGIRLISFLAVLQVLLGIFTLVSAVPPLLGIFHLATALALFGALVFVTYEMKNHEVSLL